MARSQTIDPGAPGAAGAGAQVLEADVVGSTIVDESLLMRLLRRAGRNLARPALLCLELLRDEGTPPQVRLTVLAALTYLFVPIDLIPDVIPGAGFSDDLVALSALLALCGTNVTEAIRMRAERTLDRWFPPSR